MKSNMLRISLLSLAACVAAPAFAQEGGFGVQYGNDACSNDADYLQENDIVCAAVFSETKVWDFLEALPRRISLEELIALNPALEIVDNESTITGITFVRVR